MAPQRGALGLLVCQSHHECESSVQTPNFPIFQPANAITNSPTPYSYWLVHHDLGGPEQAVAFRWLNSDPKVGGIF